MRSRLNTAPPTHRARVSDIQFPSLVLRELGPRVHWTLCGAEPFSNTIRRSQASAIWRNDWDARCGRSADVFNFLLDFYYAYDSERYRPWYFTPRNFLCYSSFFLFLMRASEDQESLDRENLFCQYSGWTACHFYFPNIGPAATKLTPLTLFTMSVYQHVSQEWSYMPPNLCLAWHIHPTQIQHFELVCFLTGTQFVLGNSVFFLPSLIFAPH